MAGLGSFLPFLQQAGSTMTAAGQTLGGVEDALRAGAGPVTDEMLQRYMNPYQDAVQDEINREAGLDPDEGGIEVPDGTDGITRYPSAGGEPIDPDDVAKYKGDMPPEQPKNGEQ